MSRLWRPGRKTADYPAMVGWWGTARIRPRPPVVGEIPLPCPRIRSEDRTTTSASAVAQLDHGPAISAGAATLGCGATVASAARQARAPSADRLTLRRRLASGALFPRPYPFRPSHQCMGSVAPGPHARIAIDPWGVRHQKSEKPAIDRRPHRNVARLLRDRLWESFLTSPCPILYTSLRPDQGIRCGPAMPSGTNSFSLCCDTISYEVIAQRTLSFHVT